MHTLDQLRAGQLAGIRRLDLAAGLTEFPREIFDLADSLEILNLSGNALRALPDDLPRLHRLRVLFCSDNQFTTLPAVLGQCPQLSMVGFKANQIHTLPAAALPPALRWLILTDNQLRSLPPELGSCQLLQKLMLAGNQLTGLPTTLASCAQLELLRISANHLADLPGWLLALPRLSWLAYAGNPFADELEAEILRRHPIRRLSWDSLTVQQRLGEGASGIIYQARWRHEDGAEQDVAVKLFKGAVTSDGLPHSEMAACISAGPHPGLIAVHGQLSDHPDGAEGLVLELIAPAFHNLAGPPSLASCTRDVYAADAAFDLPTVLSIAQRMAGAAAHLHSQGILHGDFYAHNILTTSTGESLLGDFGAASFFAAGASATADALQQLEVRAFGCLLEELLARCPANGLEPLWALQRRCAQPKVASRPFFSEIVAALTSFQGSGR